MVMEEIASGSLSWEWAHYIATFFKQSFLKMGNTWLIGINFRLLQHKERGAILPKKIVLKHEKNIQR